MERRKYFNFKLNFLIYRAVAITYDTWTAQSHHCYITVTGHFLLNGRLERCQLGFTEISSSHRADHIAELIQNLIKKNNYPKLNVVCCVSDNASNMVLAGSKLGLAFEHMGCYIHSIQLVIRDALVDCTPKNFQDEFQEKKLNHDLDM